jgi:ABC-2 type transport system permease protein
MPEGAGPGMGDGLEDRHLGALWGVIAIGERSLQQVMKEPVVVLPAILTPAFFYLINLSVLQRVGNTVTGGDYKTFLLPASVTFMMVGVSRGGYLLADMQNGYFRRLCLTPVRRASLILGVLLADFALCCCLAIPIVIIAYGSGVRFSSGLLGIGLFVLMSALWGVSFLALMYALVLFTGSSGVLNVGFMVLLLSALLTDTFVPEKFLAGWLRSVAMLNPATYLLAGLRSLISTGAGTGDVLLGFAVIAAFAAFGIWLALGALRWRLRVGV